MPKPASSPRYLVIGVRIRINRPHAGLPSYNEPFRPRADVVDRCLPDRSALSPGIVDVAADRDAGLVLADGVAKRRTAAMSAVLLLIGNALGWRMRDQHRPRGT